MGESMLFIAQLDANMVALDIKTGKEVWRTPVEDWHNGYGMTAAPLYFDGIVYTGITGGEFGIRGRLTALDAKTGKILWRAYTLAASGEPGGDTWPAGTTHYTRGGASIWNTPALDPELGLVYFAVGNCGPICSAPRSSRSTPRPAPMPGTISKCTTTSGTMTRRARSSCST